MKHTQPFRDHTIGVRHGPVDKLMVPGAVCQLDGGAFWGAKGTFLSTGICRLEGAYSVNWAWAASAALGRSSAQGRASRSSLGSGPSLTSFWPLHWPRVSEFLYASEPLYAATQQTHWKNQENYFARLGATCCVESCTTYKMPAVSSSIVDACNSC